MLWGALGRSGEGSGTLWDALGGSETFWEALVRSGDVLGCSEALWDAGMFGNALGQAPGLSATLWRRPGTSSQTWLDLRFGNAPSPRSSVVGWSDVGYN